MAGLDAATLAASTPFAAGGLLALCSGPISKTIRNHIENTVSKATKNAGIDEKSLPGHLRAASVGDDSDYSGDAVQLLSAGLLAIAGVVATVVAHLPSEVVLFVVIIAAILTFVGFLMLIDADPQIYLSHRLFGFTIVSSLTLVANIAGLVTVLVFIR